MAATAQPRTPQRIWAERALDLSQGFVGTHEVGGNNLGDQVQFWQKLGGGEPPQSWCMYFFYAMHLKSWAVGNGLLTGIDDHSNRMIMLAHADEFSRLTGISRTGSCQEFWDAQKLIGRAYDRHFNPSPGDAILYNFGSGIHHIGRAKQVVANGKIVDIEGNTKPTDAGNQTEGDGVYQRTRNRTVIVGFIHFG